MDKKKFNLSGQKVALLVTHSAIGGFGGAERFFRGLEAGLKKMVMMWISLIFQATNLHLKISLKIMITQRILICQIMKLLFQVRPPLML